MAVKTNITSRIFLRPGGLGWQMMMQRVRVNQKASTERAVSCPKAFVDRDEVGEPQIIVRMYWQQVAVISGEQNDILVAKRLNQDHEER
jgi:hypothetical protein